MRPRLAEIEEHDRDLAARELVEQRRVELGHHQRHALDAAFDEAPHVVREAARIVVGVRENHLVALLVGGGFDPLDELREERIGDVGDHQADQVAAAGGQAAGVRARIVVVAADGLEHALAVLGRDVAEVVDDARDRRGRHAGLARDVAEANLRRKRLRPGTAGQDAILHPLSAQRSRGDRNDAGVDELIAPGLTAVDGDQVARPVFSAARSALSASTGM